MLRNHQKPSTKHKFSKSHFLKTSFASTCPVKDICLSVEMSFSPLVCFSTFKFVGLVVAEYSPFLNKNHFLLKLFQSFPSPIFRHIINSHCASRQSPQYLNIWAQNIWISELTIWISEVKKTEYLSSPSEYLSKENLMLGKRLRCLFEDCMGRRGFEDKRQSP